jgi:hypothetical protein
MNETFSSFRLEKYLKSIVFVWYNTLGENFSCYDPFNLLVRSNRSGLSRQPRHGAAVPHLVKMADMPPNHPDWLQADHSHWSKRSTKESHPKAPLHKVSNHWFSPENLRYNPENVIIIYFLQINGKGWLHKLKRQFFSGDSERKTS